MFNASRISDRWKCRVYSIHLRNVYYGSRKIWVTLPWTLHFGGGLPAPSRKYPGILQKFVKAYQSRVALLMKRPVDAGQRTLPSEQSTKRDSLVTSFSVLLIQSGPQGWAFLSASALSPLPLNSAFAVWQVPGRRLTWPPFSFLPVLNLSVSL